jgi:MFS family permease
MSGCRHLLRGRDFRCLFLGQAASAVGNEVAVITLALFVIRLTGSPADLGLVLGIQASPAVLLFLFGGVWADRASRPRIMLVADVTCAALHAALAVMIVTAVVRLWEVCLIEAVVGAAGAFFRPAYTALIPQTVPADMTQAATGVLTAVANGALLVGPAIATGLFVVGGAGEGFALDALTLAISAALLTRISRGAPAEPPEEASLLQDLRAGWREVRGRRWVWVTILTSAAAIFCALAPWLVLGPVVSRESYGSSSVFGLLSAMIGAGGLAGAVLAIRWRPHRPLRCGLLVTLAWPLFDCGLAWDLPLWTEVPLAIATGTGWALMAVWWETALAANIPASALARVSAYDWMGSLVLLPVGCVVTGLLATSLGAQAVLGVGGVIGLGCVVTALAPRATRGVTGGRPRATAVANARSGEARLGGLIGVSVEPCQPERLADRRAC